MKCPKCKTQTVALYEYKPNFVDRLFVGTETSYKHIEDFTYCPECEKMFKEINKPKLKELK